ncbi:MAG: membrane protein insertase YidC [Paludibacteraceae bacterium]|nr:membrane protein insertase YidC [Paludibacteraceae bacterium]
MDKNTWIGFILIAAIIIGFMKCSGSSETSTQPKTHADSVRIAQRKEAEQAKKAYEQQRQQDSIANINYGIFDAAREGEETLDTLSNGKVRIVVSNIGGVIKQAELLEYTSATDKERPLSLFGIDAQGKKESEFSVFLQLLDTASQKTRGIFTDRLYFQPVAKDSSKVVMRLASSDPNAWLDFEYELSEDYMVYYRIKAHNLQDKLVPTSELMIDWRQRVPQHEKGRKFEERYSQLQYMFEDGDIDELDEDDYDEEHEGGHLKWIAYKDQFFSTIFIADDAFTNTKVTSAPQGRTSGYMKEYTTRTYVPFDATGEKATGFRFYMGPNHYNTLKSYEGLNLKEIVPLGWKIVSWINKILVIPMFDLFMGWGLNIGLIIILMTLVIKLIILPFVFVSYKSSAKMKALRPQLNEINEKYPADKIRERQQATMELYRQAGVSPMSGCLPMLFQFPVLMAMFWFFPTAIELRGKSFLWADDLSTYDAVVNFGFNIPLFGDHLSLFCLLMTIANIGYTYVTMQSQATDPNMKFMKYIMYAMPIMFLFIFNDYAAGLSFYYLVSLFITILQTMIFRWTLNDQKMLAEIEANKKKRAGKPKSRFMQRLEEMQREQQRMARENAKKNARR